MRLRIKSTERKCRPLGYTWDFQLKIFKNTLKMMVILIIGFVIFMKNPRPMVYGLVFGTIINMLNFRLLALTLEKSVTMPPSKAQVYVGSRYFVRYIIKGIVLFIGIKADYLNVIGVIIGLVVIKILIITMNLFNNKAFFEKIFRRKEAK